MVLSWDPSGKTGELFASLLVGSARHDGFGLISDPKLLKMQLTDGRRLVVEFDVDLVALCYAEWGNKF